LTFDKSVDIVPVWTPDDKKILFASNRSGRYAVYEKNSNGTGDDRLIVETQHHTYPTDVSSDGRYLLLSINTLGQQKWDIGVYDLQRKSMTPLLTSEFSEWIGVFSPDGKWYAYQSNETGRYEVYIRPTDGSPSKWQVSTTGGELPQWVKNGREIIFHVNNQQIHSAPITVAGNQISIGQSKMLFKIDAGFQTDVMYTSSDGAKFMIRRTMNSQTLKTASIIFQWPMVLEKR